MIYILSICSSFLLVSSYFKLFEIKVITLCYSLGVTLWLIYLQSCSFEPAITITINLNVFQV